MRAQLLPFCLSLSLVACAGMGGMSSSPPVAEQLATARAAITVPSLLQHIGVLASDAFEGRLPGTPGEDKTVAYLTEQFAALGLAPGNPQDGSYVQSVPLVGIESHAELQFVTQQGGKNIRFKPEAGRQFVAATPRVTAAVDVGDSPLVFVGYGIQAPEQHWDDYKGLDVRGKTLVMLINDPPVTQADGSPDPKVFAGKGMTYYGRWTYKYEIASRLGAAAVLIVHETEPAAYGWDVVRNSWSGEQFTLDAADGNAGLVPVQGWLSLDAAQQLLSGAGQDYAKLKAAAKSPQFRPVELPITGSYRVKTTLRKVASRNVIAKLPGRDGSLAQSPLIYTAHWDHLGREDGVGDGIYNGAVDNASGTAGLLEIARAYTRLPQRPARPVLFLAVTAEEQGLLGSRYYAQNPLYPLATTAGVINMDALNPWGPTREVQVMGSGQNSLEAVLADAANDLGRSVLPDQTPERGSYYRSDQFEFAKVGVPGLYACRGADLTDDHDGSHKALMKSYTAERYHKPDDEVDARWDLRGAVADLQLLFETGRRVADNPAAPQWYASSEFKAARDGK